METALRAILSSTLIATGLLITVAGVRTAMGKIDNDSASELLNIFSEEKPIVVKVISDKSTKIYY